MTKRWPKAKDARRKKNFCCPTLSLSLSLKGVDSTDCRQHCQAFGQFHPTSAQFKSPSTSRLCISTCKQRYIDICTLVHKTNLAPKPTTPQHQAMFTLAQTILNRMPTQKSLHQHLHSLATLHHPYNLLYESTLVVMVNYHRYMPMHLQDDIHTNTPFFVYLIAYLNVNLHASSLCLQCTHTFSCIGPFINPFAKLLPCNIKML